MDLKFRIEASPPDTTSNGTPPLDAAPTAMCSKYFTFNPSKIRQLTAKQIKYSYSTPLLTQVYALKVINNFVDAKPELLALQTVATSDRPNPHIIHVYDCWIHKNPEEHVSRTFIKMQRCTGTLLEYLGKSTSPITPLDLTEIMIQILSGLRYCHEKGVCHRDLKLSNSLSDQVR